MARSGDAFFEEDWARADNTDLGGAWTISAGDPQIVQETLKQSTSAAQTARVYATASSLAADISSEVAAQAVVACSNDSSTREFYILLRWNATDSIGYKVGLTWAQVASAEKLMLYIVKVDAVGTTFRETSLASLDVTAKAYQDSASSYIDQFQNLRCRIYDDSGEVTIEATLNDEEEPLLTATDREWPLFRGIGSFGLELEEGESSPADGYVLCDYLALQAISTAPDPAAVSPTYWTFGRLKERARSLALRSSSSNIDASEWGDWVNAAIQEMFLYCGQPIWAEEIWSFKLKQSVTSVPIPKNALDIDSVVRNTSSNEAVPIVREDHHRQSAPSETTSGVPEYFRLGGDAGRLLLRPYPLSSATRSYSLRYFRAPAYMYEDTEIPEVPDHLCEYVLWGAVLKWSYRDGDRTSTRHAAQAWDNGLKAARRIERRRGSRTHNFVIKSGLHMGGREANNTHYGRGNF